MISALASHGQSDEAVHLFFEMERSGQTPSAITVLAVVGGSLHARRIC